MSFDIAKYAAKYSGRIVMDRIGFIRRNYPKLPDVDAVLRSCAERFPNPALFLQKFSTSSQINEEDSARALGSDFFIQNKVTNQMRVAFQTGLDKLAWRCASQFHQDSQGLTKHSSIREYFDDLLMASLIILIYECSSSSVSVAPLSECESILAKAYKEIADDAAAAAKGLSSTLASSKEGDNVFYPSATDVLRCKLLRALTQLSNKNVSQCARTLLSLPEICLDVPDDKINDIATSSDIAMYAVLCSMSTMGREELRTNLFDNANFREWLEKDGCQDLKRLVNAFFHGKWSCAWHSLDAIIDNARYDMFLNKLCMQMKKAIQDTMLLEYCRAYNLIDLKTMAISFDFSRDYLEERILKLIDSGRLPARIDGIKHELVRYTPDTRTEAFESTSRAGKAFENWTDRELFYANIIDGGYLEADVCRFPDDAELAAMMMSQLAYAGAGFESKRNRRRIGTAF